MFNPGLALTVGFNSPTQGFGFDTDLLMGSSFSVDIAFTSKVLPQYAADLEDGAVRALLDELAQEMGRELIKNSRDLRPGHCSVSFLFLDLTPYGLDHL